MPVVVLFLIFVALLVIAVPVSITLGITSVLPSVFDPSFTVGAKYLIRAMFGGLDSFPLLAVPMFVLSGIIMAKGGISKNCLMSLPIFSENSPQVCRAPLSSPAFLWCDFRFRSGDRCCCRKHDNPDSDYPWL